LDTYFSQSLHLYSPSFFVDAGVAVGVAPTAPFGVCQTG